MLTRNTLQNLFILGGWENPKIVDWFSHYASTCFHEFGDKVKLWITLNEPLCTAKGANGHAYGYGKNSSSGGEDGITTYIVAHHLILAHAAAYRVYQEKYKKEQNGVCFLTVKSL